jgi:hypothetical protein
MAAIPMSAASSAAAALPAASRSILLWRAGASAVAATFSGLFGHDESSLVRFRYMSPMDSDCDLLVYFGPVCSDSDVDFEGYRQLDGCLHHFDHGTGDFLGVFRRSFYYQFIVHL